MARDPLKVTRVALTPADAQQKTTGLLGYVSLVINDGFGVDGVTLRRAVDGHLLLSFPETRDGKGRAHPIARPMDKRARAELEAQVFRKLGLDPGGEIAS